MDIAEQTDFKLQHLTDEFRRVRQASEALCAPLSIDDYQIQSIVQVSPPKWHLAHMSWFFETFVLARFIDGYQAFDPRYDYIFNSYYYTHGEMHPRASRGLLSHPTVEDIYRYRKQVDQRMLDLIATHAQPHRDELEQRVILGLNHEQQHQELLLMDIKHNRFSNPLHPAYRDDLAPAKSHGRAAAWHAQAGGIHHIGHCGDGFAYDNELPRHQVLVRDFALADRLVTNGEYLEFIEDGGYNDPALWLADGWAKIKAEGWRHPLYWQADGDHWTQFTLGGLRRLDSAEPVCHVSYYEADAYARWAGERLPSEAEVEIVLATQAVDGNFVENDHLHPIPASKQPQWFGDLWAWTASPYSAYPGFKPLEGSIGEYNGKFMSNQMVLRGGCCATPANHARASYRNFFYPDERWAFTGIRLARDL